MAIALACSSHGLVATHFCFNCHDYICMACLASGAHENHKFNLINKVFEHEKTMCQLLMKKIDVAKEDIKSVTTRISKNENGLLKFHEKTSGEIEMFFRSAAKLFEEKKRNVKYDLDEEKKKLQNKLEEALIELEDAEKTCQASLRHAEEISRRLNSEECAALVECGEACEKLKKSQLLIKELDGKLSEMLKVPPIVNFSVNTRELENLAQNLGEVSFFNENKDAGYDIPQTHTPTENALLSETLSEGTNASSESDGYDEPLSQDCSSYLDPNDHVYTDINEAYYLNVPMSMTDGGDDLPSTEEVCRPNFVIEQKATGVVMLPSKDILIADCNNSLSSVTLYNSHGQEIQALTNVAGVNIPQPKCISFYEEKNKVLIIDGQKEPRLVKIVLKKNVLTKVKRKATTKNYALQSVTNPGDMYIFTESRQPVIFITDWHQKQIFKYNTKGSLLGNIYSKHFKMPMGIVCYNDFLLVVDCCQHCIFKIGLNGEVLDTFFKRGTKNGFLYEPYGIAMLPNDYIAVTEVGNNRVSIFKIQHGKLKFEKCFGKRGTEYGQFNTPKQISFYQNFLAVVDFGNKRVQIFSMDEFLY